MHDHSGNESHFEATLIDLTLYAAIQVIDCAFHARGAASRTVVLPALAGGAEGRTRASVLLGSLGSRGSSLCETTHRTNVNSHEFLCKSMLLAAVDGYASPMAVSDCSLTL